MKHSYEIIRYNVSDCFSRYLTLDLADNLTENIIRVLPTVTRFIEEALHSNGKVLVHGNAGISRCAALVIGYVMEKHGISF